MKLRIAVIALFAAACVPALHPASDKYRAPATNEPHATVEVRTTYAKKPATSLNELVVVDGKKAATTRLPANSGSSRAIAVAPGTRVWKLKSDFGTPSTHLEKRTVKVFIPQYHTCGPLGNRLCRVMTPAEKTIMRPVTTYASAASCEAGMSQNVADGDKYVLDYQFKDDATCELKCTKQLADGTKVPCDATLLLPDPKVAMPSTAAPGNAASR